MTDNELRQLRGTCPRALTHHLWQSPRAVLTALAAATPEDLVSDVYGAGEWLALSKRASRATSEKKRRSLCHRERWLKRSR